MRIRLLSLYAGPRGTFRPGDTIEVPDEEGAQLLSGNYATKAPLGGDEPTPPPPDAPDAQPTGPEAAQGEPEPGQPAAEPAGPKTPPRSGQQVNKARTQK